MDNYKLLMVLLLLSIVATKSTNSVPLQNSKLISSIEEIQRRYSSSVDNEKLDKSEDVGNTKTSVKHNDDDDRDDSPPFFINPFRRFIPRPRQHRMLPYYPSLYALPSAFNYPTPFYYPPEFYSDFEAWNYGGFGGYDDEEEDAMSRANTGPRRRYKNSPIYYIRLPPTPYMFVPGLGYVSQPPTYNPPPPPMPPPMPVSPFYNVPVNFLANGKPSNIYQWAAPSAPQFGFPYQQQTPPVRPQRPFRRPAMNPYTQDSKVTNLKGSFLFNGRPEEIYVLPNSYSSMYPDPRLANPYY